MVSSFSHTDASAHFAQVAVHTKLYKLPFTSKFRHVMWANASQLGQTKASCLNAAVVSILQFPCFLVSRRCPAFPRPSAGFCHGLTRHEDQFVVDRHICYRDTAQRCPSVVNVFIDEPVESIQRVIDCSLT